MRLCFHRTGRPTDVLRLDPDDPRPPRAHEAAVRMLFAPVHPADLNFIEGTYGAKPTFPAVPGNEGCGRVESVGGDVCALAPGDLVIPLRPLGCWSQRLVTAAMHWFKVPSSLDPLQAAMLRVNPATAWHLLHEFATLQPGAFVAQNAANSAVGRAMIQLARDSGVRTVNFVRRPQIIDELRALGADACFLDDEDGLAAAIEYCGQTPPVVAFNAVGGDSALRLMNLLPAGGTLVTYGAMSRRSLKVPNGLLIFKDLRIRGAWITRRLAEVSPEQAAAILDSLAQKMLQGALQLPIDQIFSLDRWRDSIVRAAEPGRAGKILLRFDGEN